MSKQDFNAAHRDRVIGADQPNHTWACPLMMTAHAKTRVPPTKYHDQGRMADDLFRRLHAVLPDVAARVDMLPRYILLRLRRTRRSDGRPIGKYETGFGYRWDEFEKNPVIWAQMSLLTEQVHGVHPIGGFDDYNGESEVSSPYIIPMRSARPTGFRRVKAQRACWDPNRQPETRLFIQTNKVLVDFTVVRGSRTLPDDMYGIGYHLL